jgi:hypothetical protein
MSSKNIHILPTDKQSRLIFDKEDKTFLPLQDEPIFMEHQDLVENHHIYITNDEEIKANVYALINGVLCKTEIKEGKIVSRQLNGGATMDICKTEYLEIILTTNQDLIKDGVQAIDDEFLVWFVKNPSCESVDVNIEKYVNLTSNPIPIYKIIIPQEEPKKETLEEAAEKQWGNVHRTGVLGFIEGAKWQQEQDKKMYSEEDMRTAFNTDNRIWSNRFQDYDEVDFEEWFEQFKKK